MRRVFWRTSRDQFSFRVVLFDEVWFVVFLIGLVNNITSSFKSFSSCTPGLSCTLRALAEHMLLCGAARQVRGELDSAVTAPVLSPSLHSRTKCKEKPPGKRLILPPYFAATSQAADLLC